MRTFSILILLLVALSFCFAASPAPAIYKHGLEKRQKEHGTTTAAATATPSSSSESHNGENTATHDKKTVDKNSPKTMFATVTILTTGTLFYIGIAVTFVLWCSGFALDFLSDRQEQLAYKLALSKKHCGLSPEYPAALKA